ncbi:MAG: hypothetical protein DLM68_09585 [Hyphomicrobiales bacterium]|nr:MAG: hypothetical protein DLM68_09585 [Hyphomicrobiales bacterium]
MFDPQCGAKPPEIKANNIVGAFGRATARSWAAAANRKFTLAGVTAWIKLVAEDASVALFDLAGGRPRLTHAGQESASAALKGNERNGTAIREGSSSWNQAILESNKSRKKNAPITDRAFRKCARRSSPTPTNKSGAAKASRPCLFTK